MITSTDFAYLLNRAGPVNRLLAFSSFFMVKLVIDDRNALKVDFSKPVFETQLKPGPRGLCDTGGGSRVM